MVSKSARTEGAGAFFVVTVSYSLGLAIGKALAWGAGGALFCSRILGFSMVFEECQKIVS